MRLQTLSFLAFMALAEVGVHAIALPQAPSSAGTVTFIVDGNQQGNNQQVRPQQHNNQQNNGAIVVTNIGGVQNNRGGRQNMGAAQRLAELQAAEEQRARLAKAGNQNNQNKATLTGTAAIALATGNANNAVNATLNATAAAGNGTDNNQEQNNNQAEEEPWSNI